MRKLISLALVGGLLGGGGSMLGFGGGGGGGGGGGMDMAKMAADNQQAMYMVQLHAGAEVGQWVLVDMGAMKQWTGVTDKKGDNLVVEQRNIMDGMQLTTTAYVVDADGNTLEAYVANWDPKAEKLSAAYQMKVMAKPDAPTATGDAPQPETGEESVKVKDKDFACKWVKMNNTKTWMCDDSWFKAIIKSETDGKVTMQLADFGTDAKRGFEWPAAEKAAN